MHAINPAVLVEKQIQAALHGYLPSAVTTILTSLLLYFFLAQYAATNQLFLSIWFIVQSFLCCTWLFLYLRYRHNYQKIKPFWSTWIEIPLNIISGAGWGIGWVLFIDPNNLSTAIFLNAVICAVLLAYAIATPLHQQATIACTSACTLPIIIKSYLIGGSVFIALSIGTSILFIAVYMFGREFHKVYIRLLQQAEENKQLAKALEIEKQQVEQVSQEKTRFLAAASHDLRQPIQAMKLFENVLGSLLTDPKQHEILHKIGQSNQSLSNILEPLLDISKLDSGVVKTYPEHIYIDDIFYNLQQQYTDLAKEKNIQLKCISTFQEAFTDPKQLERILNNLVINAIKHMKREGKILLGVRKQGTGFRIEVWDNGQGVPEIEQQKIFYEFYQLDNPERNREKGMGLGLPIVKRLADLIGCQLTFRSTFGKGCYFSLYFPISPKNHKTIQAASEKAVQQDNEISLQEKIILIIEDDPSVLDALNQLLKTWGFQTHTAYDRVTAFQVLNKSVPDLILSDYQLHQQTGLEIINAMQAICNKPIPALLLTGSTGEDHIKILQNQSIPVFYKPIQPEQLKAKILQLLSAAS